MSGPYRVELLNSGHPRATFDCGVEALNAYLQRQASQDAKRRVSACYVAITNITEPAIAGYYTLAAGSVGLTDLPQALAKRLPRYPAVPVARLGRLAIATACQGQKLGAALLADAAVRASRSEVAVFALVVDAKDDTAQAFYRHHGFDDCGDKPRQMIVSLSRFLSLA